MNFSLLPLLGAIILLWTPGYLFFTARIRDRVLDTHGSNGLRLQRIAMTWQHWMDGVRGFAGAYLLYNHAFLLERALRDAFLWEFGSLTAILAVAVVIQVIYYHRHVYCLSPIFFLLGILFALFTWWIIIHGIIAGLVFGRLANTSEAFFTIVAVVIAVLGYFIEDFQLEMGLVCALLLLPIVVSLLAKENLVVALR